MQYQISARRHMKNFSGNIFCIEDIWEVSAEEKIVGMAVYCKHKGTAKWEKNWKISQMKIHYTETRNWGLDHGDMNIFDDARVER
jgi:hypothetical protein